MFGPLIQGTLVRLRPPRDEEVDAIARWFDDLEVTRFLELRHPPSVAMEKEFLDRTARDPNVVWWAVEYEGALVGGTGIHEIDWKHGFGITGTLIANKDAWNKGLARELMQLRAGYAFSQLPLRKLKSAYVDGNEASGRAQKAAGYREVGRWHKDRFVDGEWRDLVMTELMREDWAKSRSV